MKNIHPRRFAYLLLILPLLFASCARTMQQDAPTDDGKIEIAILQINDVYEIAGVSGGNEGNLARVQGYYDRLRKEYPNAMMMLAGDFLNPSLINTMEYQGESISGRQMVETLNAMDLDLVAFGNHEFDLDLEDLQKRMDESDFEWVATNIGQVVCGSIYPLYKSVDGKKHFFPEIVTKRITDGDGTSATLGIFSATIPANQKDYIRYFDPDSCAAVAISSLSEGSDILIGLTHLDIDDDIALAKREPEVDLILGGHDHDNMRHDIGDTRITKADANARTVYAHILDYDTRSGNLDIRSELVRIDPSIPADPEVQAIIDKWNRILNEKVSEVIPYPYQVVYTAEEPLDGRESTIRNKQSNLGDLINRAMLVTSKRNASASILNSGSIRIDDQIEGKLTAIEIFRVLPFDGSVLDVTMSGRLLTEVLAYSESRKGTGAYLQRYKLGRKDGRWEIDGEEILPEGKYRITLNDFLLSGYDIPFLTEDHEGILEIDRPEGPNDPRFDIRAAIIEYLERK